jgi:hypothetical protein
MFRWDVERFGRLTNGFLLTVGLDRPEMFGAAADNVYAPACHVTHFDPSRLTRSALAFGPLPFPPGDLQYLFITCNGAVSGSDPRKRE